MENTSKIQTIKIAIISAVSTLILAFILLLCTCSSGVDIQKIIPKDAEIAFYANLMNDDISDSITDLGGYDELIDELKTHNKELSAVLTSAKSGLDLSKESKELLDDLIDSDDIVGSIEDLILDQEIAIAGYKKKDRFLVAVKSDNDDLIDFVVSVLEGNKDIKSKKFEDIKIFNIEGLYIANVDDTILVSDEESYVKNAITQIDEDDDCLLDEELFQKLIQKPESLDIWVYVSPKGIMSELGNDNLNAAALEVKYISQTDVNMALSVNFKEEKALKKIIEEKSGFKASKSSGNKNLKSFTLDNSVAELHLDIASIGKIIWGIAREEMLSELDSEMDDELLFDLLCSQGNPFDIYEEGTVDLKLGFTEESLTLMAKICAKPDNEKLQELVKKLIKELK